MKKSVIVTGGTKKDVPAMAVLVLNIRDTNINLADEIIIYHDGISKKDQKIINTIFPTKFIEYRFPGDTNSFNSTITDYFSTMVFCKYECFKLLSEYHRVIWTDYDVVIRGDFSELIEPTPSGVKFIPSLETKVRQQFFDSIKEIDMSMYDMERMATCMSLFVLYDTLKNYMSIYNSCITKAIEYGKHLHLGEQGVIDLLIQDYKIEYLPLENKVYSSHPSKDKIDDSIKILHSYGQPKFWNGLKNEQWNFYYEKWLGLGGTSFLELKKKNDRINRNLINKALKKIKSIVKNILGWRR